MRVKIYKPKENIYHKVMKGETYKSIAELYCVSESKLKSHNNNQILYENIYVFVPKANRCFHIVKPLETLSSIAKLYNLTEEAILFANQSEKIFIGQRLVIPFE